VFALSVQKVWTVGIKKRARADGAALGYSALFNRTIW
jgi:hypothetical protein